MRIETDEISLCSRKMITWKGDLVMSLLMNGSLWTREQYLGQGHGRKCGVSAGGNLPDKPQLRSAAFGAEF